MAEGTWTVETLDGQRFTCFATMIVRATAAAKLAGRPIFVRYEGPRSSGNRDINRSNFKLYPEGRRDPSIDPTWYTNAGAGG